ncbi:unnamed protein product [Amoebophrya sp. A25]|nr:unnamed protein product [Amoebophrya sp. A25]|eukprot:GSA25T00016000001.1
MPETIQLVPSAIPRIVRWLCDKDKLTDMDMCMKLQELVGKATSAASLRQKDAQLELADGRFQTSKYTCYMNCDGELMSPILSFWLQLPKGQLCITINENPKSLHNFIELLGLRLTAALAKTHSKPARVTNYSILLDMQNNAENTKVGTDGARRYWQATIQQHIQNKAMGAALGLNMFNPNQNDVGLLALTNGDNGAGMRGGGGPLMLCDGNANGASSSSSSSSTRATSSRATSSRSTTVTTNASTKRANTSSAKASAPAPKRSKK